MDLDYVHFLFVGSLVVALLSLVNLAYILSSAGSSVLVTSSITSVGVMGLASLVLGLFVVEDAIEKTSETV